MNHDGNSFLSCSTPSGHLGNLAQRPIASLLSRSYVTYVTQTCCTSLSRLAQEEKKQISSIVSRTVQKKEEQLPAEKNLLILHMRFIKMKVNSIKMWICSRRGKTLNVIRGLMFNSNEKDQQLLPRSLCRFRWGGHPCGFPPHASLPLPRLLLNSLRSTVTPDNLNGRVGTAATARLPLRGRFPPPGEPLLESRRASNSFGFRDKKRRSSCFHQRPPNKDERRTR